ncbi:OXR1 [Candida oxycetoniae]|uniref:Oxidation resistance protein 1 n=1 Tax=Candida oxycetoniae TaxID=497107 RepID=A0AAI9SZ61_9ASCO|nr:OXR1 [Candida oxycetoniae]KAI3405629.2 OXR1 [Candida oxycetoniae]
MSFLFGRFQAPEKNEKTDKVDQELNEQEQQEQQEQQQQQQQQQQKIQEEKPCDLENKPIRKRTTFLKNLMGNSSRNNSSSSLLSTTSSSSDQVNTLPPLQPLTLSGYKINTKHKLLLDLELASNIRNLLPARLQLFDTWELVYSLSQHGMSLNTLYRNSRPEHQLQEMKKRKKAEKGYAEAVVTRMISSDPSNSGFTIEQKRPHGYILVIKDEKNCKFGAYLNEYLKPVEHKRYYGNGECFLWKVEKYDPSKLNYNKDSESSKLNYNKDSASSSSSSNSRTATRFKAFLYTGINDNIIYSNRDFIAIGSSHGENGLYIDQSLSKGVSYPCETFGNEVLNSKGLEGAKYGTFKIMGLEIWRVGSLE